MSTISDAVSLDRISRVVGYKITKGNFATSTPNLPQRIAVLAEANTASQSGLSELPYEPLNVQDVADKFGYGSPSYQMMRILRPVTGGGVGQQIVFYPILETAGATAGISTIVVSGTGTKVAQHYLYVNGRNNVDGQSYSYSVAASDTAAQIADKIVAAVNKVYGSPVTAAIGGTSSTVTLTTKWKGISAGVHARIDTVGIAAGMTYSISSVAGTGAPAITNALAKFENNWNTIVINPFGGDSTVLTTLETTNGKPDPVNPTGRWIGTIFKPFVALFSKSVLDPITDMSVTTRANDCTNVYCPAPNCNHFAFEVAASYCAVLAPIMQNSPHIDVNSQIVPDMLLNETVSGGIGNYASYDYRDQAIKVGLSTVDYIGGYSIQDLVTTYNPTGEITPQYRYVRNLMVDWNVRYAYLLLEQAFVVNKTLIPDGQIVGASNTIKPGQWKAILFDMFDDLADRGLIADAEFSKASLSVQISGSNPDRFETFFRYKRTGIARICSTTAEAGFYYGA